MPLQAVNLSFAYGPERAVLREVSLTLAPGEVCAIIGPNGAGKSTLVRLLLGLLTPASGGVQLGGVPITRVATSQRAAAVAYVPQRSEVAFAYSVREVVALGGYASGRVAPELIESALGLADLADRADDTFGALSAGQQQRATLARALAQLGVRESGGMVQVPAHARALLADEPVSALDPAHIASTMQLLRRMSRAGLAVGVVLHDLSLVLDDCDRVIALDASGRVAGVGPPAETLTPQLLAQVYGTEFRPLRDTQGRVGALLPVRR